MPVAAAEEQPQADPKPNPPTPEEVADVEAAERVEPTPEQDEKAAEYARDLREAKSAPVLAQVRRRYKAAKLTAEQKAGLDEFFQQEAAKFNGD